MAQRDRGSNELDNLLIENSALLLFSIINMFSFSGREGPVEISTVRCIKKIQTEVHVFLT